MRNLVYLIMAVIYVFSIESCTTVTIANKTVYSSEHKRQYVTRPSSAKEVQKKSITHNTSKIFHPTSELQKRDDIVLTAMKYAGREYKSGGKLPETGFDCSGFTSYIFSKNGIELASSSTMQAQQGNHKKLEDIEPGDLLFFGNGENINHVAIVTGRNNKDLEVIHSTTSAGVKVDNIKESDYWSSRTLFAVDVISR
ncbi:MAG: C40 family peptidase [Lewinellaceae bacterium]|nr:C40 family peptidase [Lewinellaceae bacterium]